MIARDTTTTSTFVDAVMIMIMIGWCDFSVRPPKSYLSIYTITFLFYTRTFLFYKNKAVLTVTTNSLIGTLRYLKVLELKIGRT